MDNKFFKQDIKTYFPYTITNTYIFKQWYCVLTCLQRRQLTTRNEETMLASQIVRCGNMTILAMNMYDMLPQGNKNKSHLDFELAKWSESYMK